ncbi:MAG: hypothetical protein JRN62_03840 [Nitrososphaerota archaeon]|jgi:hypothetical protein|nr:hypothetical protein [Nitrososphaerota archaeon]MDG6948734.1 hypothetical protein [Nitrososphaerota archaeon]
MSLQAQAIPAEVRQALGVGPEPILQKTDGHPWTWTPKEYALETSDARRYQEAEMRMRREDAKREAEYLRNHQCSPKFWDPTTCTHCDRPMPLPPTKAERLKAIQASNLKAGGKKSDYYNAILRRDQK